MQPEARNDVGEWPTKIAQPAVCRCTNPVDRPVPVCEPAQSRSSLSFDSCCKTPWWQTAEVRQAHEFYNVICRETDPDRAAQLLREFIVHPGTRQALKVGCRDALPKDGSHRSDWDDILQDTWLIVWGRMETERNGHRDEGLPEFAALLQKICHDGSVDVIRCRLRSRSLDITFVDPDILADVAAPPEQEHPREQLGPAIGKIRKLGVMATMTLQRNGFSVEMTAEVLGVSTRTVDRWRQQGLEELREIFADESDRDS